MWALRMKNPNKSSSRAKLLLFSEKKCNRAADLMESSAVGRELKLFEKNFNIEVYPCPVGTGFIIVLIYFLSVIRGD